MCVMILNYLDKKSMYIGLCKIPNKVLSCLVLSIVSKAACKKKKSEKKKTTEWKFPHLFFSGKTCREKVFFWATRKKTIFSGV